MFLVFWCHDPLWWYRQSNDGSVQKWWIGWLFGNGRGFANVFGDQMEIGGRHWSSNRQIAGIKPDRKYNNGNCLGSKSQTHSVQINRLFYLSRHLLFSPDNMNGLRKSKSKRRKAHPQQQPPLAATSDNAKRTKRIKSSNGDALLPSPLNASATSTATTATTATTSTTSTTSPPIDATQWGLDPLYWSYVHLTCYQINHAISTLPDKDHAHVLNNTHPLTKATIVGTVVRVVEQLSFTKYTIDDGTGMVDCIQWITKQQQQKPVVAQTVSARCCGKNKR